MERIQVDERGYEERQRQVGSSLKAGTSSVSGIMVALVFLAVVLFVAGLFVDAFYGYALFAAAAVCGFLARIAQAGHQHAELMDELRWR